MSRETICRRVVGNLDDYKRELESLRKDEGRLKNELAKLEQDLSEALTRSIEAGGGVGRRPTFGSRGGRIGTSFDVVTGIGGALLSDNSSEIRGIREQIERRRSDVGDVRRSINNIVQNVRRQQSEFNEFQCAQLGYGHEVLNIRSGDSLLEPLPAEELTRYSAAEAVVLSSSKRSIPNVSKSESRSSLRISRVAALPTTGARVAPECMTVM